MFAHDVFLSGHFDHGVFAGGEWFGGGEFEPISADAGDGGFDEVLFLADFAGELLAFDAADDALVFFYFGVDDAETVEGKAGLLGLLRLLWGLRGA